MAQILVVEDDEGVQSYITEALERSGYTVKQAQHGKEALALIASHDFDLVFSDVKMPGMNGMSLLQRVKAEHPDLTVVIITAHGTVDNAVEAMKLGADDYIQKPLTSPQQLRDLAKKHIGLAKGLHELAGSMPSAAHALIEETWRAPIMRDTLGLLHKVARTNATVLLRGESGTGKEIAARAIHAISPRAHKPMVMINCATLAGDLLESELFGHEKGAFTGAHSRRLGRIEYAHGGTVFLDEFGELSLHTQAKLLRVIQEREFERVGGNETHDVDVRWIAATNRNLHDMLEQGTFREDLYHRIAVFPIDLAPLREHLSDIDAITRIVLGKIAQEFAMPSLILSDAALARLHEYTWPGNIRELLNVLKRAAILAAGMTIDVEHLLFDQPGLLIPMPVSRPKTLADVEYNAIQAALNESDGNRRQAAEALGIGLRTLYDKLKRHKDKPS